MRIVSLLHFFTCGLSRFSCTQSRDSHMTTRLSAIKEVEVHTINEDAKQHIVLLCDKNSTLTVVFVIMLSL